MEKLSKSIYNQIDKVFGCCSTLTSHQIRSYQLVFNMICGDECEFIRPIR